MGYACPVCEAPQADAEHLANHLAFTALLRGGEHESWLDERVPDWADRDPEGLAPAVADHASERDLPEGSGTHGHDRGDRGDRFEDAVARQSGYGRDTASGEDVQAVLDEARDLTARMQGADAADEADNGKE
jgi:hypothetical protein